MANAAAITINDLGVAGAAVLATADTLDTGTGTVTLNCAAKGDLRRIVILVKNTDDDTAMTAVVKASNANPPGFRKGLGDLSQSIAFGVTRVFSGLEAARFCKADGSFDMTFTPASGTISAQITCLRLPKNV